MSNSANKTMEIKGRDLIAGIPKVVVISSDEIREALNEPIHQIVDTVLRTLERTPPELAADIVDRGIMLVGGGAMLRDFDQLLRKETQLPIVRAEDAFTAVAMGAGRVLDSIELLGEVAMPD
jgi:rod shape-determining protein MreB